MDKIILALKSRTTWTFIVLFLISGVEGVQAYIPSGALETIQAVLTFLGIYFKVTPSQKY